MQSVAMRSSFSDGRDVETMGNWTLGVDVGGTFTDLVAIDGVVVVGTSKVLTTYPDPIQGISNGIAKLIDQGLDPAECGGVTHATTLFANVVAEGTLPRTALVATKGFADVLLMRREDRYDVHSFDNPYPAVLVAESDSLEAEERMSANGEVLQPLDVDSLMLQLDELIKDGVVAVAVCLLHSYANPTHERQLKDAILRRWPGLKVVVSSEILLEPREYERTVATVLDAGLLSVAGDYLQRLKTSLRDMNFHCAFYAMSSAGDALSLDQASAHPVRLLESGPAAGQIAASHIARRLNSEVIGFDVGGTTAKTGASEDLKPVLANRLEVARMARFTPGSGYPVALRSIDLHEIGAGGGSIAHIDPTGLIEVGPESASSRPGPACYGFGGKSPTVTDANLRLGILGPDARLGGELPLQPEAAHSALESLGLPSRDAAVAIRRIVDEKMAEASRLHLVESHVESRSRVLVAFGGGGPIHAAFVAESIGVSTVFCPREAGVLSAWGLALAPLAVRTSLSRDVPLDSPDFVSDWRRAWQEARETLDLDEGSTPHSFDRAVEMRYDGQAFSLDVALGESASADAILTQEEVAEAFLKVYRQRFSRLVYKGRMTVTGFQLRAVIRPESEPTAIAPLRLADLGESGDEWPGPVERREVILDGVAAETTILRWPDDGLLRTVDGPAIIQGADTAVIIPSGWQGKVTSESDIVMEKKQ